RHDADQRKSRIQHCELCHLEALIGDVLQPIRAAPDDHGQHDQPEPDVIEHRAEAISSNEPFREKKCWPISPTRSCPTIQEPAYFGALDVRFERPPRDGM